VKKLLQQRLDFPFEKIIETTDTLPAIEAKKLLKQRFDFPFEKKN